MHDVNRIAVGKALLCDRGIGLPGRDAHRVRIRVGTEPDDGAVTIGEHAEDPGLSRAPSHLETPRIKVLGEACRGADAARYGPRSPTLLPET